MFVCAPTNIAYVRVVFPHYFRSLILNWMEIIVCYQITMGAVRREHHWMSKSMINKIYRIIWCPRVFKSHMVDIWAFFNGGLLSQLKLFLTG